MKFRLTATSSPYTVYGNSKTDADYLKDYVKMIDESAAEGLGYTIENGKVYVSIFYGSDIAALARIVKNELIVSVHDREEPTIEIYDFWRE